jgi:hypothetical protein
MNDRRRALAAQLDKVRAAIADGMRAEQQLIGQLKELDFWANQKKEQAAPVSATGDLAPATSTEAKRN